MIEIQEDLNIDNMRRRILSKCWYDKKNFPTTKDIAVATGLSERTVSRLAKDYNLPRRTKENIHKHSVQKLLKLLSW